MCCVFGLDFSLRAHLRGSTVGGIFSSASSSINGHKSIQLQASLAGSGTAAIRGESRGVGGKLQLTGLQVNARGQVIEVPVEAFGYAGGNSVTYGEGRGSDGRGTGGSGTSGSGRSSEVIDVESR